MNTNQLYIEYARCIEMCQGTALQDTPWLCVRYENGGLVYFKDHPDFAKYANNLRIWNFSLAILEDKPLFSGDLIYLKSPNQGQESGGLVKDDGRLAFDNGAQLNLKIFSSNFNLYLTWQPPTPKHTFILNGVELPCPIKTNNGVARSCYLSIEGAGFAGFKFDNQEDTEKVEQCLIDILSKAENQ